MVGVLLLLFSGTQPVVRLQDVDGLIYFRLYVSTLSPQVMPMVCQCALLIQVCCPVSPLCAHDAIDLARHLRSTLNPSRKGIMANYAADQRYLSVCQDVAAIQLIPSIPSLCAQNINASCTGSDFTLISSMKGHYGKPNLRVVCAVQQLQRHGVPRKQAGLLIDLRAHTQTQHMLCSRL